MNNVSQSFKIINNEFVSFMIPHLNAKGKTLLDEVNDKIHEIPRLLTLSELNKTNELRNFVNINEINELNKTKELRNIDKIVNINEINEINETKESDSSDSSESSDSANLSKPFLTNDEKFLEIIADKRAYKGKLAEQYIMKYLMDYIPDIEDVSTQGYKMDLYSSLKTRFEIKCWNKNEKVSYNLTKFHRDCYLNREDTNIFVYLDLSLNTTLKFHVEINPLRIYTTKFI